MYALCERQCFDSCELSQPAFGSHFLLCKRGNCIKGDLDAPWDQHRPLQTGFAPPSYELSNEDFGRSSENRKYNITERSMHMFVRLRSFDFKWSLYVPPGLTLKIPLSVHTVSLFCMDLRTNSDYFPIQH